MKKEKLIPIAVSEINSFADHEGRVLGYHLDVRFGGDLAFYHNENPLPHTIEEFKRYMKLTNTDIEGMEDDPDNGGHESIGAMFRKFKETMAFGYKTEVPYVLRQDIDIPARGNVSTVKWDEKSMEGDNKYANTLVGYVFLKGWFGYGLWCAKRFRNKMLEKINKQKIKAK